MGATLPALAVGDLVEAGGEPRVLDLRLAERLGYPEPRKIRRLIERHRPALERFGAISAHRGPKIGRGRPVEGWLLNKRQALFITTKSETPNATEVTIEMVEVFDAWASGRLGPAAPMGTDPAAIRMDAIEYRLAALEARLALLPPMDLRAAPANPGASEVRAMVVRSPADPAPAEPPWPIAGLDQISPWLPWRDAAAVDTAMAALLALLRRSEAGAPKPPPTREEIAQARWLVLGEVERREEAGLPAIQAITEMVEAARTGRLPPWLQAAARFANARGGRAGARTLSVRTLHRWRAAQRRAASKLH